MVSIAVCDDEEPIRLQLGEYCHRWQSLSGTPVKLSLFSSANQLLEGWEEDLDIVILDIQMEGLNGMEAAHRIRQRSETVDIMFVTNMLSYAVEGYQVRASHFIPKPVSFEQFSQAMDQAERALVQRNRDFFTFRAADGLVRLSKRSVLYVESGRNKILIHTREAVYEVYGTMREFEAQLGSDCFFRTHSGYLLNLLEINAINGLEIIMSDGSMTLLSKHRKKEFMERFTNVLGDSLL